MTSTANNAYESALGIVALFRKDRERIAASAEHPNAVLRLHESLQTSPFLNASQAQQKTSLSAPTVNKAFDTLQALDIVREITGKRRGRVFSYAQFLAILESGTAVPA